jgi:uracil permease
MSDAAVSGSLWSLGPIALPAFRFQRYRGLLGRGYNADCNSDHTESTAHIYQIDIYVNDLAQKKGSKKKYNLRRYA